MRQQREASTLCRLKQVHFLNESLPRRSHLALSSLLNGFPFVYYDTVFYLYHANHLFAEPSLLFRPLTYSAMLALSQSSYALVAVQCFLLSVLILKTAERLGLSLKLYLPMMFIGIIVTPMAIYSNFLLPDIFIAIQVLALFNFLTFLNVNWRIFFAFTFILASMSHYSNLIPSCMALLVIVFVKASRRVAILLLLPALILPLMHFALWKKFSTTNAASFFLFSRLTALNVSQTYLQKHCPDEKLKLCVVLSNGFDPWDRSAHGTISQLGSQSEMEAELNDVCFQILKEPALAFEFIQKSGLNWAKQFVMFSMPIENATTDFITQQNLKEYNSNDYAWFKKQTSKNYGIQGLLLLLSHLYFLFVLISVVVMAFIVKKLSRIQIQFFAYIVIALILNSLICGILTELSDRYQGRLIFLLPLFIFYIWSDQTAIVLKKISTGLDVRLRTNS